MARKRNTSSRLPATSVTKTLLEQLRAEVFGEPAPKGWYTIAQLMKLLGSKRTATESLIARKKWQMKKFRTVTNDGRDILVNHYHVGKL